MPMRLKNTKTGRITEYRLPEEIAPPERTYPTKDAKAVAERESGRQKRLLDTLRKSRRYRVTDEPVTRSTERQIAQARVEAERRRISAELRAEFEQELELEKAKLRRAAGVRGDDVGGEYPSAPDGDTTPEPSAAEVRAWAREQGLEVPARGKLGDEVVAAYKKAASEADE